MGNTALKIFQIFVDFFFDKFSQLKPINTIKAIEKKLNFLPESMEQSAFVSRAIRATMQSATIVRILCGTIL